MNRCYNQAQADPERRRSSLAATLKAPGPIKYATSRSSSPRRLNPSEDAARPLSENNARLESIIDTIERLMLEAAGGTSQDETGTSPAERQLPEQQHAYLHQTSGPRSRHSLDVNILYSLAHGASSPLAVEDSKGRERLRNRIQTM